MILLLVQKRWLPNVFAVAMSFAALVLRDGRRSSSARWIRQSMRCGDCAGYHQ